MPLASGAAARAKDRKSGRANKDRAHRDTHGLHLLDEPMYVEAPFTVRMPTNCFMTLCCVCMVPKVYAAANILVGCSQQVLRVPGEGYSDRGSAVA